MKFSSTFADGMSGSIGGITASHNRSGQYFRTKSLVTNPNTIRQQAVRSNFGTLVQYWTMTLTAAQRATWDAYAANTQVLDKLGNSINITGQNMFIRSNSVRLLIGEAIIATAPTTFNTGEPVTGLVTTTDSTPNSIGINLAGTGYDQDFAIAGAASDDGDVVFFLGAQINATRNYYKGPYQLVLSIPITSTSIVASTTAQFTAALNDNGNPVDSTYRPVMARVMYDDGRLSQAYRAILPVVTASS